MRRAVALRLRLLRQRALLFGCRLGLHRWYYFIDGNVCRACDRCEHVEYDHQQGRLMFWVHRLSRGHLGTCEWCKAVRFP